MSLSFGTWGKVLLKRGFWAYYAFETARDMLLERKPQDINIFTDADHLQLLKLFPGVEFRNNRDEHAFVPSWDFPVKFYVSDFPVDNAVRIPGVMDVRKQALLSAARTTLFAANAFFYDIKTGLFHDPLDAYQLLKKGIIKTVKSPEESSERFPTLALKSARIYSETGFFIDEALSSHLNFRGASHDYSIISEEDASDFMSICSSGRAFEALTLLDRWGVLEKLLPEVNTLKVVNQDKDHHPEGDGFSHTLHCLSCVKKPARNLMMALLLHDTGKAVTARASEKERVFPNHSVESMKLAKKVLRRFHFDHGDAEEVLYLVRNHMMLNGIKRFPPSRLKELFSSPYFPALLELYRADLLSGYHGTEGYYLAARMYREFLRTERLKSNGVYA